MANLTTTLEDVGNIVEKGAQAYKLRTKSPATRNMKTCSTVFAACSSLTDFQTTTATGSTDRPR